MTREGGNVEEWELECADNLDDAFENTDEVILQSSHQNTENE